MNLELPECAQAEIDAAAEYQIAESPSAAAAFADVIEHTFNLLCEQPEMGRRTNKRNWRVHPLTAFRYNIFYRLDGNTLIIERVFHTSQDPGKV